MKIDVLLGEALPMPAEVAGKILVVVDVLRAGTSVAAALKNGARAVIPFENTDEPVALAKQYQRDEIRLAGERRMQRISGFDLGNSPEEYTHEAVFGRRILYTTTNGTMALHSTHGARDCFLAAFVNCAVTINAVRSSTRGEGDLLIVCSGQERRVALEDVVCAGRIARGVARGRTSVTWGDGARSAALIERRFAVSLDALRKESSHARALAAAGFEADVSTCLSLDTLPVVVTYHERQLVQFERAAGSRKSSPLVK